MRSAIIIIILLCCAVAIPAAALSVDKAEVSQLAKGTTTARPVLSQALPRTMVSTEAGVPMTISISTVPSGASVFLDGSSSVFGTTPITIGLFPGAHTIRLSRTGYKDYTTSVTIVSGSQPDDLSVRLEPALQMAAARQNVSALQTTLPLHSNRTIIQGLAAASGTPRTPVVICTSGQLCLTVSDAEAIYAPGWGYRITDICGYVVSADNEPIPKYCTFGNSNVDNPPASCLSGQKCLTLADAAATYAPGWWYQEGAVCGYVVFEQNTTIIPKYCTEGSTSPVVRQPAVRALVPQSPEVSDGITGHPALPVQTLKVLGGKRQIGVIESVFGFFSGVFSRPVCEAGKTACGSRCVDLMNDSLNCGECDYTCFDPAVCIAGECDYAPPPWDNPLDDMLI